jgi:tripartite-type tricarboxylate transporter receptor subunit TctC
MTIMKLPRRKFLHLAACAAALASAFDSSLGQAQEWPARPVTMVIPTAAGGGTDLVGRILAGRLSEILGQPVIVENVGNGVAATNRVAKATPDGYHFSLSGVGQIAFHPTMYKTPVYNSRTDFAPVALVAEQPFLLVTRSDFPANNLRSSSLIQKQTKASSNTAPGPGSVRGIICRAKC